MSKFIVAAVICSLLVAIQAASLSKDSATAIFVNDLATYLSENPELEVIAELERNGNARIPIQYTLGKRVAGKCISYWGKKFLCCIKIIQCSLLLFL